MWPLIAHCLLCQITFIALCILSFLFSKCDFFSPSSYLFFLLLLPHSREHYLFTFFHFASLLSIPSTVVPRPVFPTLIFYSLKLSCLSVYAPSSPSFSPSSSHNFPPSFSLCLTPSLPPPCFSSPSLFSVSVEPLWLHRHTDCWLCRGGGMLFRHSTRRYCTSAHCHLQAKLLHQTSPCTGSVLHWGCNMKSFPVDLDVNHNTFWVQSQILCPKY